MTKLLYILIWISVSAALAVNLCSSQNLGQSQISYEYMSNGYCRDHCSNGGYAVAITQNYDCWCSDAVPGNTVDLGLCNTGCPGYSEQEDCGGSGVFGYVIFGAYSTVSGSSSVSTSATASTTSRTSTISSTSTTSTASTSTLSPTSVIASLSDLGSGASGQTSGQTSGSSESVSSGLGTGSTPGSTGDNSGSSSTSSSTSSSSTLTSNQTSVSSSSTSSPSTTSFHPTTVISVLTIDGSVTHSVSTIYVTATPSSLSSSSLPTNGSKNSFFDSSAKVAGTFTAVGVVVVALAATLIYCCCFAGGTHSDEYSDEEKQYFSDENSLFGRKDAAILPVGGLGAKSRTSSHSNLKRNTSSKSIMSMFNAVGGGSGDVSRSQSRKKLNPKNEPLESGGPIMSPISEFENVLDPRAMFEEHNSSKLSLNDENDYSRRIWHVTNPE